MKKYIHLTADAIERLESGKCVKGSLHCDKSTGKIVFMAYRTKPRSEERIVRQLEHGWLKESARRIKFFNSVKKDLGCRMVDVTIHRELKTAMTTLVNEEIINNI